VVPAVARPETPAPDAAQVVSEAPAGAHDGAQARGDERAQIVARIKHEGPREPAKRGRPADLIDEKAVAPRDGAAPAGGTPDQGPAEGPDGA
jgi:hypothetical protein